MPLLHSPNPSIHSRQGQSQSTQASIMESHRLGGFNYRHYPSRLRRLKVQDRVAAGWFPGEGSLSGLQAASFFPCHQMSERMRSKLSGSPIRH